MYLEVLRLERCSTKCEDSQRAESAKARVLNLLQDLDLKVAIQGPTSLVSSAYSTWKEHTSKAISDTHLGGFLGRNSPGGGGRPRGKVKLSKFEKEAIDLYCKVVKLAAIDSQMLGQEGTAFGPAVSTRYDAKWCLFVH